MQQMKRRLSLQLLVCAICFAGLLQSCLISDTAEITTTWTISGTSLFYGIPSGNVKLAAFYVPYGNTFSVSQLLVSNVENLGLGGGNFSLDIDVSRLTPEDEDTIKLIMWIDNGANIDAYDNTESFRLLEPTTSSDPVFGSAPWCEYYYEADESNSLLETKHGWNQKIDASIYAPIDEAVLSGAAITNWLTW